MHHKKGNGPLISILLIQLSAGFAIASPPRRPMPVPAPAPMNSGVCGECGQARCRAPLGDMPCVRIFDPVRGEILQNVECQDGRFRAALAPGRYALDRIGGKAYQLKDLEKPLTVEVKENRWTRLDGLSETQCPASGIYGAVSRPCWGNPPAWGRYRCVRVLDVNTEKTIATGDCPLATPVFSVAIPPGSYVVEMHGWPRQKIDLGPGQWLQMGVKEAPPCPPVP